MQLVTERHSELLLTTTTLDHLQSKLKRIGFNLSQCATDLWLLPRRSNIAEGKLNVDQIKDLRQENNLREKNPIEYSQKALSMTFLSSQKCLTKNTYISIK